MDTFLDVLDAEASRAECIQESGSQDALLSRLESLENVSSGMWMVTKTGYEPANPDFPPERPIHARILMFGNRYTNEREIYRIAQNWVLLYDLDPMQMFEHLKSFLITVGANSKKINGMIYEPGDTDLKRPTLGRDGVIIAERERREFLNQRVYRNPRNWTEFYRDLKVRLIVLFTENGPKLEIEEKMVR